VVRPSTAESTEIGRRDHAVAVEERAGEDAEQDDPRRPLAAFARALAADQGEQGEAAALALVVGAHDDADIFDRDDDHHRPEDQAEDADDLRGPLRQLVMAGKSLAEGVDRAGADIAEDDADRPDRKRGQASLRVSPEWASGGSLVAEALSLIGQDRKTSDDPLISTLTLPRRRGVSTAYPASQRRQSESVPL
jgi:hypothetical protein